MPFAEIPSIDAQLSRLFSPAFLENKYNPSNGSIILYMAGSLSSCVHKNATL